MSKQITADKKAIWTKSFMEGRIPFVARRTGQRPDLAAHRTLTREEKMKEEPSEASPDGASRRKEKDFYGEFDPGSG